MEYKKKLIEVALPLEVINEGCVQEKNPFLKGHPRSTHLWWARRPLAAARAVIFAQMVDDPSSHPEIFPTEDLQKIERDRLFKIIEKISKWENIKNEDILNEARQEIIKSWKTTCEDNSVSNEFLGIFNPEKLPGFHDPFAGGGALPLEAQRLGLEPYASDLNPVAVLINKAMIEIPPKFDGKPPVNPGSKQLLQGLWIGAQGLAEDVRYYGEILRQEAVKRIGHLYPKVNDEYGAEHTVIAWIWARTVRCPNPACGCEIPLSNTFVLSKKKGKEVWLEPEVNDTKISFKIHKGKCPTNKETNKIGRGAIFRCPKCSSATTDAYVKQMGKEGAIGIQLMAIVANGQSGRIYLPPNDAHIQIAEIPKPHNFPDGQMATNPRWFSPPSFGLTEFHQLFTNRQLIALNTFSELVSEMGTRIISEGGSKEYAEAIEVYLACGISQLSRYSCTICGWNKTNENVAQAFGRQAIPMVWDFAEANTLEGSLNISSTIEWPASVINSLGRVGYSQQADAQKQTITKGKVVSTDPPYYDNIGYADLSDFFYVWLRRSLKTAYPQLFSTLLVPKAEELVATPYRHGNKADAEVFFLEGMKSAMHNISLQAHPAFPVTIYYAFKQSDSETESGVSSTGWETFLEAVLGAGFSITGTWPLRTERTKGLKGEVNALASSIVLVCRKRSKNAPICTRRDFINTLRNELKPALKNLQASNIAPVDLAQSAIGPGMGVFSRFKEVLEADGKYMNVRSALQLINQELDTYFTEQDGVLDRDSRFCIDLYTQYAFNDMRFGEADVLARAKNTSVEKLVSRNILYAQKGVVKLLTREEIPEKIESKERNIWLLTQQMTKALEKDGVSGVAKIIADIYTSEPEHAKALAYRLFQIAERKGWA
ncbi:MAG TPA: hypothetical protein DEO33_01120, partial [Rikenellaceae bacterium]|nr:hypothetical protein [Rikenellaceae bacterium]